MTKSTSNTPNVDEQTRSSEAHIHEHLNNKKENKQLYIDTSVIQVPFDRQDGEYLSSIKYRR